MGRKRKGVESIAVAKEDKTSNGCSETTFAVEKLHPHADNSNAMGDMNVGNSNGAVPDINVQQNSNGVVPDINVQQNSNGVMPEKVSRVTNAGVRRSERLKNWVSPSGSLEVMPVVEHVDLVEDEKEEAPHSQPQQDDSLPVLREENSEREKRVQQVTTLPEVNQRSLEEKVDYLISAVDEFKSKIYGQVLGRQNEGSSDISYKSLYIDSQKKIEALMEENYDLVRKLEFARGKIAAYETMKNAAREVILVSALGKAPEGTTSLSPQPMQACSHPPAAATVADAADDPKQKKHYKKKAKC